MIKDNLVFTLALSAICLTLHAQTKQLEYRPFAQEGKTWETQVGLIKENVYGNCIDGDTLINGAYWKKVFNYVGFPDFNYTYYAAIRDEGKKVYAIMKGSSRPRLLYDFGLNVGDIVKCGVEGNAFGCLLDDGEQPDTLLGFPFEAHLKVERIDTVMVHGLEYRRFTITRLDAYKEYMPSETGEGPRIGNVIWVEGIGSSAGPFLPWISIPSYHTLFLGCSLDKSFLFGYEDFYDAEISTSIGSALVPNSTNHHPFDLSGRRLSVTSTSSVPSVLPKGVYIENGKKRVRK